VTGLQLGTSDLAEQVPALVREAAVVALVPVTDLRGWAAEMAWEVAQAAARGGRRTALVDCFVDAPTLHAVAGSPNNEGLVDAFEYGASLNRIVQQQPEANLYFIPSGTFTPDPQGLMANPRWRRLSAGFRHEEALLLLYVAPEHLGGLAAEPDGVIVLAPLGLDTAAVEAPALLEAIGRGMPLLAVVADEAALRLSGATRAPDLGGAPGGEGSGAESTDEPTWRSAAGAAAGDAAASAITEPVGAPGSTRGEKHPPLFRQLDLGERRTRWPVWVLGVALLLGAAGYLFRDPLARAAASLRAPGPAAAADTAASTPAPVDAPVDPASWAAQVGAVRTLARAHTLADSLEALGAPAIVAPVRLGVRGVLYRVYVGPFRDAARTDSALAALHAAGFAAARAARAESVPLSVPLTGGLPREAAAAERARLREAGVPAFVLREAGGTFRLWVGAYADPGHAALLTDLLTPIGAAVPVPRLGAVP
jgi:hypothetical protein